MTTANFQTIAIRAAEECERQKTDLEHVAHLIMAHAWLLGQAVVEPKIVILDPIRINQLHEIIVPQYEGAGYRDTPVTFANLEMGIHPDSIPRSMDMLSCNGEQLTPSEWVKEFLVIHPFQDGNGRTAYLLFNYLSGSLHEPVNLPDFFS